MEYDPVKHGKIAAVKYEGRCETCGHKVTAEVSVGESVPPDRIPCVTCGLKGHWRTIRMLEQ